MAGDIWNDILVASSDYLTSGTVAANFVSAFIPILIIGWLVSMIPLKEGRNGRQ